MSATTLAPNVRTVDRNGDDDGLFHLFCDCRGPDVGLCGTDLTDVPERDPLPGEQHCAVCHDIAENECCPCCGCEERP